MYFGISYIHICTTIPVFFCWSPQCYKYQIYVKIYLYTRPGIKKIFTFFVPFILFHVVYTHLNNIFYSIATPTPLKWKTTRALLYLIPRLYSIIFPEIIFQLLILYNYLLHIVYNKIRQSELKYAVAVNLLVFIYTWTIWGCLLYIYGRFDNNRKYIYSHYFILNLVEKKKSI